MFVQRYTTLHKSDDATGLLYKFGAAWLGSGDTSIGSQVLFLHPSCTQIQYNAYPFALQFSEK